MTEQLQSDLSQFDPRLRPPELPRERGMIVEERVLPQMGTEPRDLAKQRYEGRILSKTDQLDTLLGLFVDSVPKWRGGDKLRAILDSYYLRKRSEGGWQQGMFVKSAGASTGQPRIPELAQRPGWVGRHVTDRGWKDRAKAEGKDLPPGEQ